MVIVTIKQEQIGIFFGVINNFRFIVSLIMTKHVLDVCLPITRALQSSSIDVLSAIESIVSLKTLAQFMRDDVDSIHNKWYSIALSLAEEVGVQEWKPRNCTFQKNRNNIPCADISEYYKRSITIPLLDNFVSDINFFNNEAVIAYHGLSILPARVVSNQPIKCNLSWKEQFLKFSKFYENDLPNPSTLSGELDAWENDWLKSEISPPTSISLTLKLIKFDGYNNIKEALPVTSCE